MQNPKVFDSDNEGKKQTTLVFFGIELGNLRGGVVLIWMQKYIFLDF